MRFAVLHLGHQLRLGRCHAFGALGADRVGICHITQIARNLADHILKSGFLKICLDNLKRVGLCFVAALAHQISRPEAQQLVTARFCLELHFFVMGIFVFKSFFAVLERVHCRVPLLELTVEFFRSNMAFRARHRKPCCMLAAGRGMI